MLNFVAYLPLIETRLDHTFGQITFKVKQAGTVCILSRFNGLFHLQNVGKCKTNF